MNLQNKKVTVIGLGKSGMSAALLLNERGAHVRVTDTCNAAQLKDAIARLRQLSIPVETGAHTEEFLKGSDLAVVSPGVDTASLVLQWAQAMKIPVMSELELGAQYCRGTIIAVTGTNGKSTVCSLIGRVLCEAGLPVITCGNIGNPLCGEIARITAETIVVVEVSSFQLEHITTFRPAVSVILNITDDHLDRYPDFPAYYDQKLKIFSNQKEGDTVILNYDAPNIRSLKDRITATTLFYSARERVRGAYVKDGSIVYEKDGTMISLMPAEEIPLPGAHNVENVLASSLAALELGAGPESIRTAVRFFTGLEHRLQTVAAVDGIEFIDDSKSTTVDSTMRALQWCSRPTILIAGGKSKRSDYTAIKDIASKKLKALILIGETSGALRALLGDAATTYLEDSLENAVKRSYEIAAKGDTVLLSPMCSSFDMFNSYHHRGTIFKEAVTRLTSKHEHVT